MSGHLLVFSVYAQATNISGSKTVNFGQLLNWNSYWPYAQPIAAGLEKWISHSPFHPLPPHRNRTPKIQPGVLAECCELPKWSGVEYNQNRIWCIIALKYETYSGNNLSISWKSTDKI